MAEISRYLHISTAHIPELVINGPGGLDAVEGVIAYHYPEGAWLWVPDDVDEHLEASGYTPALNAGLCGPNKSARCIPEIERLWRDARSRGCDFINLAPGAGPEPDLRTYLRLSTAHIPERLINGSGGLNAIDGVTAHQYPEGGWLSVPDDVDSHLAAYGYAPAEDAKQIRKAHEGERDLWPRSLDEIETLWRYARALGCDFIRLDADEEHDPNLKRYPWR
jgi:hypothetical protein